MLEDDGLRNLGLVSLGVMKSVRGKLPLAACLLFCILIGRCSCRLRLPRHFKAPSPSPSLVSPLCHLSHNLTNPKRGCERTHSGIFVNVAKMSHVVKQDCIFSGCQHSCSLQREDGRFL